MNTKMILDIDTGIDDAMAIAYAVSDPQIDLIGVIGSYGNIKAKLAARNSIQILDLLEANNVPVFIGTENPIDHTYHREPINSQIHGENGIGDVELPLPIREVREENAVNFILDSAKKYQDQLTIVATGPMTNLALAVQKDPKTMQAIGNITIMGGAITVPGNVTPVSEANINQDPKGADILFKSNLNITMVGLDVTLRTLLTKKETSQWRQLGEAGTKFADIVDYYIDCYDDIYPELGGCSLHDPLAVGVAVKPDFVEVIDLNVMVTTENDAFYGRTIGDKARLNDPNTNVKVAVNVDKDNYLKTFMNHFNQLFKDVK